MTYKPLEVIPRSLLAQDVLASLERADNIDLLIEQINFVTASGATQTLPAPTAKRISRIVLTANCVVTMPVPIAGTSVFVYTEQDGTGNRTVRFPSVRWFGGGDIPTPTPTARSVDRYEFECVDGQGWNCISFVADIEAPLVVGTSLMLDQIGVTATGAYSLRKIASQYEGAAISVQRASDNTFTDIGFDVNGNLNTAAIGTFCNGSAGYVRRWYDQSGAGNHLGAASITNMPRIYTGSAVETQNGKPCVRATDGVRGLTANITSYTGATLSGSVVGVLKATATTFSPRYLSFYSGSNTDANDATGVILIGRNGGSSPTQQWATFRNGAVRSTISGQYDILQQVDAVITDSASSYMVAADAQEATGATSVGNFAFSRVAIGYTGGGFNSVDGMAWSEVIFWQAALSSTQRAALRTNQKGYYGTGQTTPNPGTPSYVGTLIAQDNFETGQFNADNVDILNNGHMTSFGGAWMADMVTISGGAVNIGCRLTTTPQTVIDGNASGGSYQSRKRGGYIGWYPNGGTRRGGVWVWEAQMDGNSRGFSWVPLLWADPWPQRGEIDGPPEIATSSNDKIGGSCFVHWTTNNGANTGFANHIQKQLGGIGSIDWRVRHKCAIAWNPGTDSVGTGAYIKFYVDDVLRSQILWNDPADSSGRTGRNYIPHGPNSTAMNLRIQSEGYGTSEANTVTGPVYMKVFRMAVYQLP